MVIICLPRNGILPICWTAKTKTPGTIEMSYLIEDTGAVTVRMKLDFTKTKVKKFIKVGTRLSLAKGTEMSLSMEMVMMKVTVTDRLIRG